MAKKHAITTVATTKAATTVLYVFKISKQKIINKKANLEISQCFISFISKKKLSSYFFILIFFFWWFFFLFFAASLCCRATFNRIVKTDNLRLPLTTATLTEFSKSISLKSKLNAALLELFCVITNWLHFAVTSDRSFSTITR